MLPENIHNRSNEDKYKILKYKNFKHQLIKIDNKKGDSANIKVLRAYGNNIHDDPEIIQLALENYKKCSYGKVHTYFQ